MNSTLLLLSSLFPSLGSAKRYLSGAIDAFLPITSYAQHGEDIVLDALLNTSSSIQGHYVDIGSNHPTSISNTYFMYRKGLCGLCVEPNRELASLHRLFRTRDIVIEVAVSDSPSISPFTISKTPVLSSLNPEIVSNAWKTSYVPVLTLDQVYTAVSGTLEGPLLVLSVDTEGFNANVLKAGIMTLQAAMFVCVEISTSEEQAQILSLIEHLGQFRLIMTLGCNLIFQNLRF